MSLPLHNIRFPDEFFAVYIVREGRTFPKALLASPKWFETIFRKGGEMLLHVVYVDFLAELDVGDFEPADVAEAEWWDSKNARRPTGRTAPRYTEADGTGGLWIRSHQRMKITHSASIGTFPPPAIDALRHAGFMLRFGLGVMASESRLIAAHQLP